MTATREPGQMAGPLVWIAMYRAEEVVGLDFGKLLGSVLLGGMQHTN